MQWQSASEKLICEKLLDILEITPFQTIKVTEFVRFAGISRSCFYLYFDSTYSVVQKLEDDFIEGLTEENQVIIPHFSDYSSNRIDPRTIEKVEYIRQNIRTIRILTGENGDPSFQMRMANRTWRIFRKQFAHCTKLSESQKKLVCEYMCGGQMNLYRWYANNENEISIYEVGTLLEKLTSKILSLLE